MLLKFWETDTFKVLFTLGILLAIIVSCGIYMRYNAPNIEEDIDLTNMSYNWIDDIQIVYEAVIHEWPTNDKPITHLRRITLVSKNFSTDELKTTAGSINKMITDLVNDRNAAVKDIITSKLKKRGCIEKTENGRTFMACPAL